MRKVILQPSERILMEELWEDNPQTITQLFHTLNEKRDWTKSTVSTMLNRIWNEELTNGRLLPEALPLSKVVFSCC